MIAEADLDAIVIAAPTTAHVPLALAAIERGIAVLVEKPLAATTDEAMRIVVAARREGESVVVSVKDDGIGIDGAEIDRVFEMFAQVDHSLERSRGGLGIGLTLVRRLVEMHGGSVAATSAGRDRGSEFVVTLPLHHPSSEAMLVTEPAVVPAGR